MTTAQLDAGQRAIALARALATPGRPIADRILDVLSFRGSATVEEIDRTLQAHGVKRTSPAVVQNRCRRLMTRGLIAAQAEEDYLGPTRWALTAGAESRGSQLQVSLVGDDIDIRVYRPRTVMNRDLEPTDNGLRFAAKHLPATIKALMSLEARVRAEGLIPEGA